MPQTFKGKGKKCAKCGKVKPLSEFGSHESASDGKQSYCRECKNALGVKRREVNVGARLKHHIATRVNEQLGNLAPKNLTKELERLLGYKMVTLVKVLRIDLRTREPGKKLRDALNEGYHVDHVKPLSKYPVIKDGVVDWDEFRRCWDPANLSAIPAAENLAKGASYSE